MNNGALIRDPLHGMLAHLIVVTLDLDAGRASELEPGLPLVGGRLGLTNLDILEVAVCIEEQFDVSFNDSVNSQEGLKNIASLASFIRRQAPVSIVASLPALDVEFDEAEVNQTDRFRV